MSGAHAMRFNNGDRRSNVAFAINRFYQSHFWLE